LALYSQQLLLLLLQLQLAAKRDHCADLWPGWQPAAGLLASLQLRLGQCPAGQHSRFANQQGLEHQCAAARFAAKQSIVNLRYGHDFWEHDAAKDIHASHTHIATSIYLRSELEHWTALTRIMFNVKTHPCALSSVGREGASSLS
jgi:hypothetical protein